jgi:hypothetical protein
MALDRRSRRAAGLCRILGFIGVAGLLPPSAWAAPAPTTAPGGDAPSPTVAGEEVTRTSAPTPAATWGGGGASKYYCATGESSSRNACPDSGMMSSPYNKQPKPDSTWNGWARQGSAAGELTVHVKQAVHLNDQTDLLGAAGMGDPYVEVTVYRQAIAESDLGGGNHPVSVKRTHTITSEVKNPVWDKELHLGVHESANWVKMSVWDADSGLEAFPFGDDLLGSAMLRAPFCSMFYYDDDEVTCGHDEEMCRSGVSAWESPLRKVCNVTAWIRLGEEEPEKPGVYTVVEGFDQDVNFLYAPGYVPEKSDCPSGCLEVTMSVVPFEVVVYSHNLYDGEPNLKGEDAEFLTNEYPTWASKRGLGVTIAADIEEVGGDDDATWAWRDTGDDKVSYADPFGYINMEKRAQNSPTMNWKMAKELKGGYMIQTQKEDKYLVADKYIEVAINYDAFLWVCRYSDDDANRGGDGMEVLFSNTDGKGAGAECTESARKNKLCALPKWLRESRGWQTTTNYVEDDSEYDAPYRCFRKFYSATRMNRYSKSPNDDAFLLGHWSQDPDDDPYGYAMKPKEKIVLGGNGVKQQKKNDLAYNYFVVVFPALEGSRPEAPEYTMDFSNAEFMQRTIEQIFILVFISCTVRLLRDIDFRIERIPTWLMGLQKEGKDRRVAAFLFEPSFNKTPENQEWCENVYYTTKAIQLIMLAPLGLLWAWGSSIVSTVDPPGSGFFIFFMGTAAFLTWFAFKLWVAQGWLMTPRILHSLAFAGVCVLFFCVAVVFVDPAVYIGSSPTSFVGLSVIFLTLNAMPLIPFYFMKDEDAKDAMKQFMVTINTSTKQLRERRPITEDDKKSRKGQYPPSFGRRVFAVARCANDEVQQGSADVRPEGSPRSREPHVSHVVGLSGGVLDFGVGIHGARLAGVVEHRLLAFV